MSVLYGMTTKLTLRMDAELVKQAKIEAHRRGKSVSRMVAEYFDSLAQPRHTAARVPPITASLTGILKDSSVSEDDYRRHLREKHL